MEYAVFRQSALPRINGVPTWEGQQLGEATISILFVEAPPGKGPRLHSHPYEEVFLIHAGEARFTIGETSIDLVAGQLVVVGPQVPHKFVNSGKETLWQTDIHLSATIKTTWLEG
jgi:mannose-6-phosphate isomerase-like protein (cupin superfamily)